MSLLVAALAGLPGAGKTTLARELHQRLKFDVVDRDAIRHAVFETCTYTRAESRVAERTVLDTVAANCTRGVNSLVDGMTFARRAVRRRFASHAQQHGAQFVVLWLDCPHVLARRRVQADSVNGVHAAADRLPALVDRIAAGFEPPVNALRVDAAAPAEQVIATAHALLTTTMESVA